MCIRDSVWGDREADFLVDGEPVLQGAPSPRGPLGLVIWIDNQYLIVHPAGRLRHGILPLPHDQWLELDAVALQSTI